jgi:hypothetical protein
MPDIPDTTFEFEARGDNDFWFACVDIKVMLDKELTPCDKAIFAVICSHADVKTRKIILSVKTIAEETGCGVRTAQKSMQALVGRGVIERVERFANGKQMASSYRIVGHRAICYAKNSEEIGAQNLRGPSNIAPVGAQNLRGKDLEPGSYDNKDYSPSESAERAPGRPVDIAEVPSPMRQVVDYFLLRTKRQGITESELASIRALERIHYPARVNQEIVTAIERFARNGRDVGSLTIDYLYEALKNQPGRKARQRAAPADRKREKDERQRNIDWERQQQEEIMKAFGGG